MERIPFAGDEDALTERIIGVLYKVANELGYGFVESVYRKSLAIALAQDGLDVALEVNLPVSFRGELVGVFRADIIVEKRIILETKTADLISKAHEAQLLNYLRACMIEIGLVLNFGQVPRVRRMQYRNLQKASVVACS